MMKCIFFAIGLLFAYSSGAIAEDGGSWEALREEVKSLGKPGWRPMLTYVAQLHEKSTHAPEWPLDYPWEEIGLGYEYGPAFGHWDIVHQIMDALPTYPQHALNQLLNNIKNQEPTGFIPGSLWMPGGLEKRESAIWNKDTQSHPPVWVVGVQEYMERTGMERTGNLEILPQFYQALLSQIKWFETHRKAKGNGFYYNDIALRKKWESGIDCGIRFDDAPKDTLACIDATCHVYWLYKHAALWAKQLDEDPAPFEKREKELREFIQTDLYCAENGMFYDNWAMQDKQYRHLYFESMWPVVTGAASESQANRYIDEYLMNPAVFFTEHPIATVGRNDPKFELRLWRGGAWNSMTYWAMRGCLNYGRTDAAVKLAEKALDDTGKQFDRTGTIWEYYHPDGGKPEDVRRKGTSPTSTPSKDYLGHNPVIAMARIYDAISEEVAK